MVNRWTFKTVADTDIIVLRLKKRVKKDTTWVKSYCQSSPVLCSLQKDSYWETLYSGKVLVRLYIWHSLCSDLCVNFASGPEFEKGAISPKIGCNLQMNFLHAWLLHKRICPDSDWTQLNDPIHIPDFFTRQCFPFSQTQKSKISMFSGATSVTDWALFFVCLQPLVRSPTGTKWHWKELVLFQG